MLTRSSRSSRSALSVIGLGVPLLALAQALTSCGDDSGGGDRACEPGEPKACVVAGRDCEGVQTCTSDGSGYSPCACPGEGAGGTAGAGGNGGSAGGNQGGAAGTGPGLGDSLFAVEERARGTPCSAVSDCPVAANGEAPLTCVTSTSADPFGGGPQGGYCTMPCTASEECAAVDPLSACGLIVNGSGYCISLCAPGVGGPVKCGDAPGDRAQACISIAEDDSIGACFPMCESDAGCGDGQFCNLGRDVLGVCTTTAPAGGDVGDPCTEENEATDCKSGICLTLLDAAGEEAGSFCSAGCTYGVLQGCGFEEDAAGREAFCLQPQSANGDFGDLGLCFELCDADTDCAQPGWFCDEFSAELQTFVGRAGECLPPTLAGGDAGIDAAAD